MENESSTSIKSSKHQSSQQIRSLTDPDNIAGNLSRSEKSVIKNHYWNEHHKKVLIVLHKYSNNLYKRYHHSHIKYKNKLQWFRIPIIIISSVGGFLSISNSGYIPQAYQQWVSLLVGFFNLLVTVVSLIEHFKKLDTITNNAYTSYQKFKKLNDEISFILRIPANERDSNGNATITTFFKKFEATIIDSPILDELGTDYLELNDFVSANLDQNIEHNEQLINKTNLLYDKINLDEDVQLDDLQINTPTNSIDNILNKNRFINMKKNLSDVDSELNLNLNIDIDEKENNLNNLVDSQLISNPLFNKDNKDKDKEKESVVEQTPKKSNTALQVAVFEELSESGTHLRNEIKKLAQNQNIQNLDLDKK